MTHLGIMVLKSQHRRERDARTVSLTLDNATEDAGCHIRFVPLYCAVVPLWFRFQIKRL